MRIDLYNTTATQAESLADQKQVQAQNSSAPHATGEGDHATLTSGAGSTASLVSGAMSSPEIRQDKVESLQQAISSGKYKIDPEQIAGAMIDEHA
jgi:negative regulator of flagellin synthesis FlgM